MMINDYLIAIILLTLSIGAVLHGIVVGKIIKRLKIVEKELAKKGKKK